MRIYIPIFNLIFIEQMRKSNLFVMLATALTLNLCLTGCSNDNEPVSGVITSGKPTAMELTINAPRTPQTYATDDGNATDAEIEMKTVTVLIYSETAVGSYILEKSASLNRSDFESSLISPDTYVLKDASKITTTTGSKKLYVLMNYPGTLPAVGSPLTSLSNLEYGLGAADDLSSTSNGLAMSSVEEKTTTLVTEGDAGYNTNNKVTISVKRMVAKVTVQENITRNGTGDIESEGGILTKLQFAIGHANKKIYAFQNKVGASPIIVQDPNWNSYVIGDFFDISDYSLNSSEYLPVDDTSSSVLNLKTVYAPENTAATYNVDGDNLTYISVRAQYQPAFFSDGNGDSKGANSGPVKTFYVISKTDGTVLYFDDLNEANTYGTNIGATVSAPYTNGICYFRAYINKNGTPDGNIPGSAAAKYDVLRNNYYKATVSSIKAPGKPTDQGKVTEETSLICNITVQPWFVVNENHDL